MTRRWPLILLALPAGVATWSGWVGLGELTGFGPVKPLPGIADSFTINTAVTLPIGVETYAAYAMGAWLTEGTGISDGTRKFARASAIGSLVLGMLGQVAYHLLTAAHQAAITAGKVAPNAAPAAPWLITTVVSCLPVLVLGLAAALSHMLARDAQAAPEPIPGPVETVEQAPEEPAEAAEESAPQESPPGDEPDEDDVPRYVPESLPEELATQAASRFLADVVTGDVPGVRRIKAELSIGQEKAQQVRAYLATLAAQ